MFLIHLPIKVEAMFFKDTISVLQSAYISTATLLNIPLYRALNIKSADAHNLILQKATGCYKTNVTDIYD